MRRSFHPRMPSQLGSPDHTDRLENRAPVKPGVSSEERAVLVGVLLPTSTADPRDPLGELASLADSAGVEPVDAMIQKRLSFDGASVIGKGKLAELCEHVQNHNANVVIFDNDLLPRQIRKLEEMVGCKVIDRSELILDIFASRAKTREAQLQVELAQLEYTAPRLRGMWTHLERIAGAGGGTGAGVVGGVGTRGPGERQIEIDRRIVRQRIAHLKRELELIDQRKQREVHARSDQFTVSLVGYTNSGKTTLLNRLTDAQQYAADQLFATVDTKTVRWDLGDGQSALLSDTVGFVRDIPHELVASFRATLEQTIHANLLLHVIDISSLRAWHHMEVVDDVLTGLGCENVPRILVLNKIDIADDVSVTEILARRGRPSVAISAQTGEGVARLVHRVAELVKGELIDAALLVPHANGKVLATLRRFDAIKDTRYVSKGVELDLRMNRIQLTQLLEQHPDVQILSGLDDTRLDATDGL